MSAEPVRRLRHEASGGRRKDDAHDLVVREPEVAQPLPVGIGNRARVVHELLGDVHEVAFGNPSRTIWFHDRRSR